MIPMRRSLPELLVAAAAWGVFLLAGAWFVYEFFLPHPDWLEGRPTLRPAREAPDERVLLKRVRKTPPTPADAGWKPASLSPRWQWIVVHHSATVSGNASVFDEYHTKSRKMENGLAYHFVIGNGQGSGDGEVEISRRWREQLDGGHTGERDPSGKPWNQISLGICLVGDFTESMPTERQVASLKGLLNWLIDLTAVEEGRIRGHGAMTGQQTLCPGRYLALEELVRCRQQPR